jgi:hypothetical protein
VAVEGACRLLSVGLLRVVQIKLDLDWDLTVLLSKRCRKWVLLSLDSWEGLLCEDGLCVVSAPACIGVVLVYVAVDFLEAVGGGLIYDGTVCQLTMVCMVDAAVVATLLASC